MTEYPVYDTLGQDIALPKKKNLEKVQSLSL